MCILCHEILSEGLVEGRNGIADYVGIEEAFEFSMKRGGNKAGR